MKELCSFESQYIVPDVTLRTRSLAILCHSVLTQHARSVAPLSDGPPPLSDGPPLLSTSCNSTRPVFTQNIRQTEPWPFALFTTSCGEFSQKIIWVNQVKRQFV
jgi:hypothetical protein